MAIKPILRNFCVFCADSNWLPFNSRVTILPSIATCHLTTNVHSAHVSQHIGVVGRVGVGVHEPDGRVVGQGGGQGGGGVGGRRSQGQGDTLYRSRVDRVHLNKYYCLNDVSIFNFKSVNSFDLIKYWIL